MSQDNISNDENDHILVKNVIDAAGIEKAHPCSWMVWGVVNSYNAHYLAQQDLVQEYLTQIVVQHCLLRESRRARVESPLQKRGGGL